MKKIIISLALLMSVGSIMGQTPEDKAKAKAEAAALKAATKEAKTQMADAQKVYDAISAKIKEKTAGDPEIFEECKKGSELIQKAIKSGLIEEKKVSEAYKLSTDLAFIPHNKLLMDYAAVQLPFDTAYFVSNMKVLTESIAKELETTKVVKGETGNEAHLKMRKSNLAMVGDHYIYGAQFEAQSQHYESALECYEIAMNYKEKYPIVADIINLRIPEEQIAYYAFHTAHEAKMYDAMDKFYEKAMQFADGAEGTKQTKVYSFLERGDSTAWANYVHEMTVKDPAGNTDYVQMLLSYYQKKGTDAMVKYADDILAVDPNLYIANYGKAYVLFATEKYVESMTYYKKCTEIKPDQYDGWYQCGLCKYRMALEKNSTISNIKDQKKAQAALEETKALFGEAIPFFEKAREVTPDEPMKWAYELKQCYTVTGQADKAAEMDALL